MNSLLTAVYLAIGSFNGLVTLIGESSPLLSSLLFSFS